MPFRRQVTIQFFSFKHKMSVGTLTNKSQPFRDFNPRDIPLCAMWFDASGSSNFLLDSNGNVQEWRSKGAQTYTLSQSTASNRPFYDSNINGVVFGSTLSHLRLKEGLRSLQIKDCFRRGVNGSYVAPANNCIFFVLNIPTPVSNSDLFWIQYTDLAQSPSRIRIETDETLYITTGGFQNSRVGRISNFTINQPVLITQYASGTIETGRNDPYIFINGKTTSLTDLTGELKIDNIAQDLSATVAGIGTIHEILIYGSNISPYQRQMVEIYLAQKWNIPLSNVDLTNPYRNYVPYVKLLSNLLPVSRTPIAWFDAQDNSTLTFSGNTLSEWRSKYSITNGLCFPALYNATFSHTASSAPVYSSNALNGFPAFGFDGNNRTVMIMTTSGTFHTSDFTHFLVTSLNTGGPAYWQRILQLDVSGEVNVYSRVLHRRSDILVGMTNYREGINGITNSNLSNQPLILTVEESSSNNPLCRKNIYVNGALGGFAASNQNSNGSTISSLTMGGPWGIPYIETLSFANFTFASISLGEWIMFYPALSRGERLAVESYLANKWNITLSSGRNIPSIDILYTNTTINFSNALSMSHSYFSNTGIPRPVAKFPLIFTPNIQNAMVLWLDSADRSTIHVNGSTITWLDKSPLSNHFSNMSGTFLEKGNIQQYMPAIQDASGFSVLNSPFVGSNTPIAMFIVSRATSNGNCLFTTAVSTTGTHYFTTNSGGYGAGIRGVANFTPLTSSSPVLQSLYSRGTPNVLRYDVNTNTLSTTGALSWTTGVSPYYFTKVSAGYEIGEVLIFQLSGDRTFWASIEGYLAWKWGLQGYLPSNHPFYSSSP